MKSKATYRADGFIDAGEPDVEGDPHAEFDAATELCVNGEHYVHEGCDCAIHKAEGLVGVAW